MSYTAIVTMGEQCLSDIITYWYACKDMAIAGALGVTAIQIIIWGVLRICNRNGEWKTSSYYLRHLSKLLILFLDSIYAVYVLYVTLGMRYVGQRQEVNLNLFHIGSMEWRFVIENLLLFIPFGFLVPITNNKLKKCRWVLVTAFIVSVVIEGSQYIFRCGRTEADDVILNVSGALIGFGVYKTVKEIKKLTKCFLCKRTIARTYNNTSR